MIKHHDNFEESEDSDLFEDSVNLDGYADGDDQYGDFNRSRLKKNKHRQDVRRRLEEIQDRKRHKQRNTFMDDDSHDDFYVTDFDDLEDDASVRSKKKKPSHRETNKRTDDHHDRKKGRAFNDDDDA